MESRIGCTRGAAAPFAVQANSPYGIDDKRRQTNRRGKWRGQVSSARAFNGLPVPKVGDRRLYRDMSIQDYQRTRENYELEMTAKPRSMNETS